jgi:GxxExxY protein
MKTKRITTHEEERIASAIVNAAYQVHKALGPGLLEKVYEICFCHVLRKNGFDVKRQFPVPIHFDGLFFDEGFRLDVLVNDLVICELKAVDMMNPVWEAQLLSHLTLMDKKTRILDKFQCSPNQTRNLPKSNVTSSSF